MNIAVSADGPDLEANVAHAFGTAPYLLIVDLSTETFEAVPSPGATGQRGAGMQAVVLAISKDVKAVVTGYCGPVAQRQFTENGIDVCTGVSGKVKDVVDRYRKGELKEGEALTGAPLDGAMIWRDAVVQALRRSARQFATILPMLVGVVLLIGLFSAFVPQDLLLAIFSGNPLLDTLLGASFGSLFAGNPISSYVIGGELLAAGASLFAVTALIVAWVTVGVIQLPAEIAVMGTRFALVRNALSLVMAMGIAAVTVLILRLVSGLD